LRQLHWCGSSKTGQCNLDSIAQGSAVTRSVIGQKPYAAVYYELTPTGSPASRMVRVDFTATTGMGDPLLQIVQVGAGNELIDGSPLGQGELLEDGSIYPD
jgi:hypothetical protein